MKVLLSGRATHLLELATLLSLVSLLSGCGILGFKFKEKPREVNAASTSAGSTPPVRETSTATSAKLDTSYGLQGRIVTSVSNRWDIPAAIAQQKLGVNAGKVVVAGDSHNQIDNMKHFDVVLTRYDANGTIDRSFGGSSNGIARRMHDTIRGGFVSDIKVLSDDSIVVAGTFESSVNGMDFFLMKFSPSGVFLFVTQVDFVSSTTHRNDSASRMAIDGNGKIWMVGHSEFPFGRTRMAAARLSGTGTLEYQGLFDVNTAANSAARAIGFQNGLPILVGYASNGSHSDMAAIRLDVNGLMDMTFGTQGKLVFDVGWSKDDHANAVVVQSDGKLILAGDTSNGNDMDFALVRFDANGNLDTSFGTNGRLVTTFELDDHLTSLIQVGDRFFASGYVLKDNFYRFAVAVVTSAGEVESKVTVDFGAYVSSFARGALALPDGGLLVTGESYQGSTQFDFSLAKIRRL